MPKPIVVLGANGGIGRAIALRLAGEGRPLILGGRDADRLAEVSGRTGCGDLLVCDCTDEGSVKRAFEAVAGEHGALAGLVFSVARPFKYRLAHRTPWEVFAEQIDSQLKALHSVAAAAFPLLSAHEGTARLVVIGSELTLGAPPLKTAPYAAAKSAMSAYAQVIAQEWLKHGIRVHILAPGLVRTELVADMPDAFLDQIAEAMPEKRLTAAEDVAAMVAFCMTDAADLLYGTPIRVSRAGRR
ncbi:MAG TPA: SDR family oxidoreductase [Allosphingosinicella sp.]|nr:SDR family oxidoreductase [Allosphingosinicella sp.]